MLGFETDIQSVNHVNGAMKISVSLLNKTIIHTYKFKKSEAEVLEVNFKKSTKREKS